MGPSAQSDSQLHSRLKPGNRCYHERRKHTVKHTGSRTQDRDRVCTGLWPQEKIRTLKCWGLVCSCQLLSKVQTTPCIPGLCSVANSPFMSLSSILMWFGDVKISFVFFYEMIADNGFCFLNFYCSTTWPGH